MDDSEAKFNRRFLAYFAVGLMIAAMSYVAAITFLPVPEKNTRFADTVLGFILGTLVTTLINFFYGSSKTNQTKDQTIQALVAAAPPSEVIALTVPPEPPKEIL